MKGYTMICFKCSHEIPDGARFCPNCGADTSSSDANVRPNIPTPVSEQKYFCEKCGLELERGAKFCSVCGGAAKARDIRPTDTAATVTDSNIMQTVSAGVPTPANDVPAPSYSIPQPVNTNSGFGGFSAGYSGTGTGTGTSTASRASDAAFAENQPAAQPAATYAPQSDGFSAAAAAPAKKRSFAPLIIVSAIVVLLAAAAVFFFTNKATALSLILGKTKYAAMVEGNSIREVTNQIDMNAVSGGVKSVSEFYSAFSGTDMTDGAIAPMSNTAASKSAQFEFDTAEIVKILTENLSEIYGAKCADVKLSGSLTLSDAVKEQLGNADAVNEIISIINNGSITYKEAADGKNAGFSFDANTGKVSVNLKMVVTDDNYVYFSLPFASEQTFKIKGTKPDETTVEELKALELDAKEMERLLSELVQIYLENYKEAVTELEKGEITAADVSVSGKVICAEFTGDKLNKLFKELAEHFADDEYFRNEFISYAADCGWEVTEQDYKDAVVNSFNFEAEADDKLVIKTVINNSGDVLGKSVGIFAEDDSLELSYAVSDKTSAGEMIYKDFNGETYTATAILDEKSDSDGTFTISIPTGEAQDLTVIVEYTDVKTEKFRNKDTYTGTFTVSLGIPQSFSEQLGADAFAALSGAKLTFSTAVMGEDSTVTTFVCEVPNYGKASVTSELKLSDDTSVLEIPADAVDITDIENIDSDILEKFTADVMSAVSDIAKQHSALGIDALTSDQPYDDDFDFDFDNNFDFDDDFNFDDDSDSDLGIDDFDNYDDYFGDNYADSGLSAEELISYIDEDLEKLNDIKDRDLTPEQETLLNILLTKYADLKTKFETEGYTVENDKEYWFLYDKLFDLYFSL